MAHGLPGTPSASGDTRPKKRAAPGANGGGSCRTDRGHVAPARAMCWQRCVGGSQQPPSFRSAAGGVMNTSVPSIGPCSGDLEQKCGAGARVRWRVDPSQLAGRATPWSNNTRTSDRPQEVRASLGSLTGTRASRGVIRFIGGGPATHRRKTDAGSPPRSGANGIGIPVDNDGGYTGVSTGRWWWGTGRWLTAPGLQEQGQRGPTWPRRPPADVSARRILSRGPGRSRRR